MRFFYKLLFMTVFFTTTLFGDDLELFSSNYSFKNISINYLDWSKNTEEKSSQRDFTYLEFEAGAGYEWGSAYMFFDVENPTKSYSVNDSQNLRFAIKPIFDIKIAQSDLNVYLQNYFYKSKNFYVLNSFSGLSYRFQRGDLLFKPFLTAHFQDSSYYSGANGYVYGWFLQYDFGLLNEKFTILNWHEHEFKRAKEHYLDNSGESIGDGRSYGTQGAVEFFWHPKKEITTGFQFRYADHKLGYNGEQNALISTVKYNF